MKSYFLAFCFKAFGYPFFGVMAGISFLLKENVVPLLPHFSLAVQFYQELAAFRATRFILSSGSTIVNTTNNIFSY
jgi:hypothetical protein